MLELKVVFVKLLEVLGMSILLVLLFAALAVCWLFQTLLEGNRDTPFNLRP